MCDPHKCTEKSIHYNKAATKYNKQYTLCEYNNSRHKKYTHSYVCMNKYNKYIYI